MFKELSIAICYDTRAKVHQLVSLKPYNQEILNSQSVTTFQDFGIYDLGMGTAITDLVHDSSEQPIQATVGGTQFALETPMTQLQLFDKIKPYILSQRLFLDQGCEQCASKFELVEAQDPYLSNLLAENLKLTKLYYLYLMIENDPVQHTMVDENSTKSHLIKVYSINLYYDSNQPSHSQFSIGGIKKVRYIEGCSDMWGHSLLDYSSSVAEYFNSPEETLDLEQTIVTSIRNSEQLRHNLSAGHTMASDGLSEPSKLEYISFLNFRANRFLMMETKFCDSVVVLDNDRKRFKLYLGKDCVYEFGLNPDSLASKMLPGERIREVNIVKPGVIRLGVESLHNNNHGQPLKRAIHLANSIPQINHSLLTTLLRVWLSVFPAKSYYELIKDLLLNCFDLHQMSTIPVCLGSEESILSNFKARSSTLQMRISTYFGFLLTADEKNPCTLEELANMLSPHSHLGDFKRLGGVSDEETDENSKTEGSRAWESIQTQQQLDQDLFEYADMFSTLSKTFSPDSLKTDSGHQTDPSKRNGSSSPLNSAKQEEISAELPKIGLSIDSFKQGKVRLFKFLHLLYEDLKLNSMRNTSKDELGFFLYVYARQLMLPQSWNYCDYYSRDNPDYPYMYSSNPSLQIVDSIGHIRCKDKLSNEAALHSSHKTSFPMGQLESEEQEFCSERVEEEPFDVHKFLTSLLSDRDSYLKKYPILFRKTHFLAKVFIMNGDSFKEKIIKVMSRLSTYLPADLKSQQEPQSRLPYYPIHKITFTPNQEIARLETMMTNLKSRNTIKRKSDNRAVDAIFLFMVEQKFPQSALDTFGIGIRTIVEHVLREIRVSLPSYLFDPSLPKGAYALIGREDIYMNILLYPKVKPMSALLSNTGGRQTGNSYYLHEKNPNNQSGMGGSGGNNPNASFGAIGNTPQQPISRDQTLLSHNQQYASYGADRNNSMMSDRPSGQGLANPEGYLSNYSHVKEERKEARGEDFGSRTLSTYFEGLNNIKLNIQDDLVFNEIQRILNISDLIRIKSKYIDQLPNDPERQDIENEPQLLRRFLIRRLSILVGRGAITVNTDRSLFTEVLHIPKINLTAILENTNRKMPLEKKEETFNWPEFHSGVAVGLKIPREILQQKNKDTIRTWIDYQKTNYESYDKPGLIYALGLQGLLYCFLPTDIYLYLKPLYEPRSIGIMLGLAASKIGSRDENIMKAVGVHLSCTYQEYTDLQLAMTVECAGLVSIGLIYKGTCNKQFSQVMLREIMAKPNKEKNHERER